MDASAQTESPLRVLHVVEAFGGGVLEVVRILADRLVDLGAETAIAYGLRAETPDDVTSVLGPDVEAYPLPWTSRSLPAQLRAAAALRRLHRQWHPDVVHLHSSFAGLVGAAVLRGRAPLIYTPHGYSFTMSSSHSLARSGFQLAERYVAARVSMIGAVSQWEAHLARTRTTAADVCTVENGIPELDCPPEAPLPPPSRRPVVIGMGRICDARRPPEAAAILAGVRPLAAVHWVGGAANPSDRDAFARNRVPVTGWLPRDEALGHLRSASIYLHWAAWDAAAPLAVLEAFAYDVPVVGSDIPPLRCVLGEDQLASGVEEAVTRIERILGDTKLRRRILCHQRRQRQAYGAERMARRWLRQYERLAARGSPPAAREE